MTKLRLLHIEDSDDDGLLVLQALKRGGVVADAERVDTAAALEAALTLGPWDAVLSDYVLPRFDGPQALKMVRAADPDVPFLIVSGRIGEETAVDMMRAGAQDYILKQNLARLAPALARELGKAEERRARRRAEEALQKSEAHFRSLIENALDIIAVLNVDGTLRYASPSIERVLGRRPEEMTGKKAIVFVHPDDAPVIFRAYSQSLESGAGGVNAAFRVRHKDGGWRALEGIGDVVLDAHGLVSIIVNARDVTERKQLEEKLRQSQRVESFGRLAGAVAQDFNTLMTAILGYSDLLLDKLPEPNPLRADIFEIQKAGRRAAALTQQILAFSRQQTYLPTEIDVTDFMHRMARVLPRVMGGDRSVAADCERGAGAVKADANQLEQVFLTLAAHAREAAMDLSVAASPVDMTESQFRLTDNAAPGPYVLFAFTFKPTDCHRTTALFDPAAGINLAAVIGIVKQNGGFIRMDETTAEGPSFRVYFPRLEDAGRAAEAPPESVETVLMVENDASLRPLLKTALTRHGYKVLEAATADEAVAFVQKEPVDLLLVDEVLPGFATSDMAARLRRARPGLKFLCLTGSAEGGAGVPLEAETLEKPFSLEALVRKTREMLGRALTAK